MDRLEEAHRLTREQLGVAAAYSKSWYDRRVKKQDFTDGEAVRILDQRGYARRTPKWQLPYRQIGKIVRKLNDVTYVVTAPGWRGQRVLHVDKLRKMESLLLDREDPAGPDPLVTWGPGRQDPAGPGREDPSGPVPQWTQSSIVSC